jgi:signal transduction histidine kinase
VTGPISLRRHLRASIVKQSVFGIVAMSVVLVSVTYFLGRFKSATDLQDSAKAAAKGFRSRILEGNIKYVQLQLRDLLKLGASEQVLILNRDKQLIYKNGGDTYFPPTCNLIGLACITNFSNTTEILEPIYFDEDQQKLFGYLFLSREIQIDWGFLAIISSVFGLGYLAVFFGVTQITKSTMRLLVDGLESWSSRLSKDPKDIASFSETPYIEFQPLKLAIESLNHKIETYESNAAEKAKLLLLRGIAHDILGPVAQAQLYLATLKIKSGNYPELENLVLEADESLQKVSLIASQVKMLKNLPVVNVQIELVSCLQRDIHLLNRNPDVVDKNIKITLDNCGINAVEVSITEAELLRILQNLIQNAVHASNKNSKIQVSIKRIGFTVVVSVKDDGHGIPTEIQSMVFQPEFTSKPGTGTGLGLSVVKHISESRGGSVRLQSSTLGTVVDVIFPVQFSEGGSHGI